MYKLYFYEELKKEEIKKGIGRTLKRVTSVARKVTSSAPPEREVSSKVTKCLTLYSYQQDQKYNILHEVTGFFPLASSYILTQVALLALHLLVFHLSIYDELDSR